MPKDPSVERKREKRPHEERRREGGATPPEHDAGRAPEVEPGVEWHAGEDAGEVPSPDDAGDETGPERDERDAGDAGVVPA
jgi:hypothetical protein